MHEVWPELPYAAWKDTKDTLHMWTQLLGKTALSHSPLVNHWWNAGLVVTPTGLATQTLYEGETAFEVGFNFYNEQEYLTGKDFATGFRLGNMPVADFHDAYMAMLHSPGLRAHIWPQAVEVPWKVDLRTDVEHHTYDPEAARRFHQVLLQVQRVLGIFRARFTGKCSPLLFWWGTFDMAVARFPGGPLPPRKAPM